MSTTHQIKRGISLFSFQEKFYRGELSLEQCIAQAAAFGIDGIEMLPDQMLPGYPSITYNLTDQFVGQWNEWMLKYKVSPISFDIYGETKLYKHRPLTEQEILDQLIALMKTGKALGFKIIRLTIHLSYSIIEKCIPYAEEMGLLLAVECHAPHFMNGEWVSKNIEIIQRTGTKSLGIMPDLGTFSHRIPTVVIQDALRHGAQGHIIDYLIEVYNSRKTPKDLMDKIARMNGNAADMWLAQRVLIGVWVYHDPKHLLDIMPYIVHVHGKFYEMGEQGEELNINYQEIIPLLIKRGYKGYIMSEYEGQRLTQGMDVGYDEIEQVRRHQDMLKQLLGEKA